MDGWVRLRMRVQLVILNQTSAGEKKTKVITWMRPWFSPTPTRQNWVILVAHPCSFHRIPIFSHPKLSFLLCGLFQPTFTLVNLRELGQTMNCNLPSTFDQIGRAQCPQSPKAANVSSGRLPVRVQRFPRGWAGIPNSRGSISSCFQVLVLKAHVPEDAQVSRASHHCPSLTGHLSHSPEIFMQISPAGINTQVPNNRMVLNLQVRSENVKYSNNWEINHFLN